MTTTLVTGARPRRARRRRLAVRLGYRLTYPTVYTARDAGAM